MATYLHAREADAYARLLAKRRRPKNAAPSFRFEPRAMPTIEERPPFVGLPPPGLRYTLYAPRRAEAAVDEQAAAVAESRRRAAAARDWCRRVEALVLCWFRMTLISGQCSYGPVAQWIRHRPTEPGIAGSSPAGVIFPMVLFCQS